MFYENESSQGYNIEENDSGIPAAKTPSDDNSVDFSKGTTNFPSPTPSEANKSPNPSTVPSHDDEIDLEDLYPALITYNTNLVLVNKWHILSKSFVPDDLASLSEIRQASYINARSWSIKLKKCALEALDKMLKRAEEEGLSGIVISSGYRTYGEQNSYYKSKIQQLKKYYDEETAVQKAASIVAPPGESEHQTGLAIDLTTKELMAKSSQLLPEFGKTPQGKWIYENSWKFGFVIRYQPDKTNITGIVNEPWHIRYVGLPHAEFMFRNNLCLEEYIDYLKRQGTVNFKDIYGTSYEITYHHEEALPEEAEYYVDKIRIIYISSTGEGGVIATEILEH